jgi:hypothetical protein
MAKRQLTRELAEKEAAKYSTRTEFRNCDPGLYSTVLVRWRDLLEGMPSRRTYAEGLAEGYAKAKRELQGASGG